MWQYLLEIYVDGERIESYCGSYEFIARMMYSESFVANVNESWRGSIEWKYSSFRY